MVSDQVRLGTADPADGISIGPFDPEGGRLAEWLAAVNLVFKHHAPMPDGWVESRVPVYRAQRLFAARDAGRVVGTLRSWDTALTVPGGSVTADAISTVTVQPTHTRRGVMTRMMRTELSAAAARGTAVAILVASEAPLYGRFGFGAGTRAVDAVVDRRAARLRPEGAALAAGVELHTIDDSQLRTLGPVLYERCRRPGDIDRMDSYWDQLCGLTPTPWPRTDSEVVVLARTAGGEPAGVLRYAATERWKHRVPDGEVQVKLLLATNPAAHAALWHYLLRLDLVARIKLTDDDPDPALPWLLTDPRTYQVRSTDDFLWTRVLDPAALLAARKYPAGPGRMVISVRDGGGWAGGRFALEVADDGTAGCAPTDLPADVELPVDVLGAAWLGQPGALAAAVAGRGTELRPGAMERFGALLATPRAPFSSTWF